MQFFSGVSRTKGFKKIFCILAVFVLFAAPLISNANENFSPIEDVLETQLNSNEIRKLQQVENMTVKQVSCYPTHRKLMQQILSGNVRDGVKTLPLNILDIFIAKSGQFPAS